MSHKLTRLSRSILEQPQLILPSRFEEIASVLNNEDRSSLYDAALKAEDGKDKRSSDLSETEVGVLRIEGALTNKPTMFGALCGLTSYQELLQQTDELCAMDSVETIMMQVDSGGGEAFNLFNAATQIKEKCNAADKKLIAYVDGISASAAYGLTSVADEVIIHPDSMVGSIGVVVRLVNTSKAEQEAGIEVKYVTFGSSKVPLDENGEFKEEFTQDIQDRVNELGSQFISHVSLNRGISEKSVEDTQAKMFSSKKAVELGLADKIMTNEEFYTYLADVSEDKEDRKESKTNTIKLEDDTTSQTQMSTEDTQMSDENKTEASVDTEMLAELKATMEKQAEQLAMYQAKEEEAAKAALSESLNKFEFLADNQEAVVSFLSDNSVSEDHKTLLNSVMESALLSNESIKEKAAKDISDAQLAAEKAQEEKESIKEEFGKEEHASTEKPEEALSVTDVLAAKVAQKKAAKLAAKAQ